MTTPVLNNLAFLFRCTRCNVRDEISRTCLCRDGGHWVQTQDYRNSDAGRARSKVDRSRVINPIDTSSCSFMWGP